MISTKASLILGLAIASGMALGKEHKTPSAMNIPVDETTVPAATTGKTVAPSQNSDNTGRNKIHDGKNAVAADQQSNAKADVEITRQIRQHIVSDDTLSTNAHNVKIITNNGTVVLKGPVNNNAEKLSIESKAKEVAGVKSVVSEIEVTASH